MLLSQLLELFCQDFLTACFVKKKEFTFMPDNLTSLQAKRAILFSGSFSGVIGAIDGTHIPIIAPAKDEHLFVNRKGFHSINVQVKVCRFPEKTYSKFFKRFCFAMQAICDANMVFLDVVCKYPGSCHDSLILCHSKVYSSSIYSRNIHGVYL